MNYVIDLLPGLATTMVLWLSVVALGFPAGLLLGYGLAHGPIPVRVALVVVVNIARGFPALVTLYFVYSGLPDIGILLSNTVSAVLAFAFTSAGYTAGIFRAAIKGVPAAQTEAAAVLGLGFVKTQRLVILPQALKAVTAPLIGFSVLILQATSLGYAVGLRELTGLAYNLGTTSFHALQYMLAAGLIYLVLCLAVSRLAALVGARTGRRRALNSAQQMNELELTQ